jgi:plasmid maintenance system killer protein
MKNNKNLSIELYTEVRKIIISTKENVYRVINNSQVYAYWDIGRAIIQDEQKGNKRAEYGKAVLIELAYKLTDEFGKAFDERELRRMRQFYMIFQIRDALRPELSWTHYRIVLKVESGKAREYYLKEAVEQGWSTARMSVLKSANNLSEVPTLPPERRHALTGQELGQFAVDIKQPYRIVFEPTIKPVPELQTGGLDLSKVTEITILEVEDYH